MGKGEQGLVLLNTLRSSAICVLKRDRESPCKSAFQEGPFRAASGHQRVCPMKHSWAPHLHGKLRALGLLHSALLRVPLERLPPLWPQGADAHGRPRTPNQRLPWDQPHKGQMCPLQSRGQGQSQVAEARLGIHLVESIPVALLLCKGMGHLKRSPTTDWVKLQLQGHLSASYRNGLWHRMGQ